MTHSFFDSCFLMHAWPAVVRGRQESDDELVLLSGQQLIRRIRLLGDVPWALKDCQ